MLSLRYRMEVNLVGDSAETLRALLPLLQNKEDRSWCASVEKRLADWWKKLSPRIPANTIVTNDSGSVANWHARDLKVQRGMLCSLSGGHWRAGHRKIS